MGSSVRLSLACGERQEVKPEGSSRWRVTGKVSNTFIGSWGRSGFDSQAGSLQERAPHASLKKKADVAIGVKLTSEGLET